MLTVFICTYFILKLYYTILTYHEQNDFIRMTDFCLHSGNCEHIVGLVE